MGDALLRFIVIGDIPGTDLQMGYKGSIAFASLIAIGAVTYFILGQRRRVARIIRDYHPSKLIELITL